MRRGRCSAWRAARAGRSRAWTSRCGPRRSRRPSGPGCRSTRWVERAVREALQPEPDPAPPEGVEIDELEAMVRRVVAEELGPVRGVLGRLEALAAPGPAGREPATFRRERMRRRRSP